MIKVLGHRGYSAKEIENSTSAFNEAFRHGADGVELDIQKSKDGKFFVYHDLDLYRLTGHEALICNLTHHEIEGLALPNGEKIPLLEEILKLSPDKSCINIELKESIDIDAFIQLSKILNRFPQLNFLISSFDHQLIKKVLPVSYPTGLLIEKGKGFLWPLKLIHDLFSIETSYINPPIYPVTCPFSFFYILFLMVLKLSGKKLAFWTVNSVEEYNKVAKLAEIIITNEVELLRGTVNKFKGKK